MKKIILSIIAAVMVAVPVVASAPAASAQVGVSTAVSDHRTFLETFKQAQARGKAADYLSFTAFSRKGLIAQLKFEGFSTKLATYGVDHVRVSWKKQAVKKAKAYLEFSHFSRSGLIDQLVFEGFTRAQAIHGVNKTGL